MDEAEREREKKRLKRWLFALIAAMVLLLGFSNIIAVLMFPRFFSAHPGFTVFVPMLFFFPLLFSLRANAKRYAALNKKTVEPSKVSRIRNDSPAPEDKLSIPLNGVVEALQKDAATNKNDFRGVGRFVLVLLVVLSKLFDSRHPVSPHARLVIGGVSAGVLLYSAGKALYAMNVRQRRAKTLLKFYDQYRVPQLVLDSRGLKIPAILLALRDKNLDALMQSGNDTLQVGWKDIERWDVFSPPATPRPRYRHLYECFHQLKIANPPASVTQGVSLRGDFIADQDRLFDYARHFLNVPIEIGSSVPSLNNGVSGLGVANYSAGRTFLRVGITIAIIIAVVILARA